MKKIINTFLFIIVVTANLFAQDVAVRKQQYNLDRAGLAIKGYDPVAYFVKREAVEGKKEIATIYNGVTYHFSTIENRRIFKKNPQLYEPQYGGWCAYAMGSAGKKVEINPHTFKVVDGKLYLFYNKYFNNTLTTWNKDEAYLKSSADKNWVTFIR